MTRQSEQPPPAPAPSGDASTSAAATAATVTAREAELRRLRSACAGLSARLHALVRTRRQLAAQVSLLATEAVEAGCRGELWITHEGKSNESKFHRVVRSSEITCGRERGELAARAEEEEMGSGSGGSAGGGSGGSGAKRKGTSPTNGSSNAGGGAAGSDQHSPSSSEVRHKLCCVPGCTKKEQGKWYGKMCKRHWAERNPKRDEAVTPEAGSIRPIALGGGNKTGAVPSSAEKTKKDEEVDEGNGNVPPPRPAKTATSDAPAGTEMAAGPAVQASAQPTAAAPAGKSPAAAPVTSRPAKDAAEKKTTASPVAGEKRPAGAEAEAAVSADGPSSSASSSAHASGRGHPSQKKRKVEIFGEAADAGAGAGAGVGAGPKAPPTKTAAATGTTQDAAPTTAAPTVVTGAAPSAKKDGIHQESDGKWSAAVLHTDGQSYGLGATFDTQELATLALGAFRSTLANESRAAGGRISEAMVKQAREMARHAVLAKGRKKSSSGQKQN